MGLFTGRVAIVRGTFGMTVLFLLPPAIPGQDIMIAGWSGDWNAEITPSGCSLETSFRDRTVELNPGISFESYVTHDPFRLFFAYSEAPFPSALGEIPAGTLFLWLQPQVWDDLARSQMDIVGASIGDLGFDLHRPPNSPELRAYYLVGTDAVSIYRELIEDRPVVIEIQTERDLVFSRRIPLANGRESRFRTWSTMFEACDEDRRN